MFVHFVNRLFEYIGIYLIHKLKKGRYKDMIPTNKEEAKKKFKETKENYLKNPTNENWIKFCDAKIECRRLGVII